MTQTQADVIAELAQRGYDISPRRLTDWRQKELLPPLAQHGRGQGKAWVWVWHEPDIVEHVIAVQELLWIYERTDWLYVPLWCLGFPIQLHQVQSRILATIDAQLAYLTGGARDPASVADRLSELARDDARHRRTRRRQPLLSELELEYWLNLLAGDADYAPDRDALSAMAATFNRLFGGDEQPAAFAWSAPWFRYFRSQTQLPRVPAATSRGGPACPRWGIGRWCTVIGGRSPM